MKKVILFLAFLLPNIIWAQITNHFNHIDSRWNVATTNPAPTKEHRDFVATTTAIYGYNGDTMINNHIWFKLYATNDSLFQKNLKYIGITRTENNIVFFIDTLNKLDTLYNYNLNIGDSVFFKSQNSFSEKLPVTEIDSVEINGEMCKRIKFGESPFIDFSWYREEWIEGIGSVHGPLFPKYPRRFSEERPEYMDVICTFSDNQQVYKRPNYKSCYINITLGIAKKETLNFKIYPNPFTNFIQIENSSNENFDLIILNSLGQEIKKIENATNLENIDLSELTDGIYLLTINTQNGSKSVKLIKE